MKKTILTILFLFHTAFAAVSANLDRNPIAMGETVTLTLTTSDDATSTPDFSALNKNFTILSTGTSNEINIVNGKQTRKFQWVLILMPKQQGTLTIPAFKVGNTSTQAISLTVNAAPKLLSSNAPIFLEVHVSPKHAYVNTPVNYTVKLFSLTNSLSGQLSPPQINNLAFKVLGDQKNYQLQRHNKIYNVIEWHLIFFPTQTGHLKIPGAVFYGTVPIANPLSQQDQLLALSGGRTVRLVAPDVNLEVRALPANISLAAKQVTLTESWATSPAQLQVGQPITRTLTLRAVGVAGNQLPAINAPAPDNTNSYPDQPRIDTTVNGEDMVGTREEKIAYIPQQSGELKIPAVEINWLNTSTGKMETANLPAQVYQIHAENSNTPTTAPAKLTTSAPALNLSQAAPAPTASALPTTHKPNYWLWLCIIVIILWLITMFIWWRSTKRKKDLFVAAPLNKQDVRQALRNACNNNDAKQVQQALIDWAKLNWPLANIRNLGEILAQDISPVLRAEVEKLNEILYKNLNNQCDGHQVWLAFVAEEEYAQKNTLILKKDDGLPPLHPE